MSMKNGSNTDAEYQNEMFKCHKLRASLRRIECAKRNVRRVLISWYGGNIVNLFDTLENRFCTTCKLGLLHAQQIGLKIGDEDVTSAAPKKREKKRV
jgi:hypothetical protein